MDDKQRCQSCGMPLGEGYYGTNADGSDSPDYCKFCYQNGDFTNLDVTLEDMIKLSVENMTDDFKMPQQQAQQLARSVIPTLKRWVQ